MKRIYLLILTGFVFNQNILAQIFKKDAGLAHTFSIVADREKSHEGSHGRVWGSDPTGVS